MRNEVTGIIGKIMLKTEGTMVKQLSKEIWEEMVKHGGIALLICQMSALANKVAYKAHEKAGQLLEKEVRINTLNRSIRANRVCDYRYARRNDIRNNM